MAYIAKALDNTQPILFDIGAYAVKSGLGTLTFDDGSGAGGFTTEPSDVDKAVLLGVDNDLSGVNTLKNNSTNTELFMLDLGDTYLTFLILWRAVITMSGAGSTMLKFQRSSDGTTWTDLTSLNTAGDDTTYFVYAGMPKFMRYVRLYGNSTAATTRTIQWGRLVIYADARSMP